MSKRSRALLVGLALLVAVEGGILLNFNFSDVQSAFLSKLRPRAQKTFREYASDVVKKCAEAPWKPGCYDEEIPKLMDFLSFEDTFQVTKEVQQLDGNYWYCHVLGHNISARETAKDPSKWKEVVAMCPSGMCSNGCIHGAFQERFREESLDDSEVEALLPDLRSICEEKPNWHPTDMERATCYHALGHLMMYITDADIQKSNSLCERVAPKNLKTCLDGNFMQIFQPLEPEDFALVEKFDMDTPEKAANFCRQFTGKQFGACWRESWPLSKKEIRTPTGLVKFCEQIKGDPGEKETCYDAMFYILAAQSGLKADVIKSFCADMPKNVRGQCFANSASRFLETDYDLIDAAVDICATAADLGAGKECYDELVKESKFNFHAESDGALTLCSKLPEPWKSECLRPGVD